MKNKQGTKGAWFRYLVISAALALVLSTVALAFPVQTQAVNPSSGQVSVTGRVDGPPPTTASTIESPLNGDTFSRVHIPITGTCPTSGLIIRIIDNGQFVGSTVCGANGNFSLNIDLFNGTNTLTAQEFDALDQQGPDSVAITVLYNPPAITTSTRVVNNVPNALQASQLHIDFDPTHGGYTSCSVGQQLTLPFRVQGGEAPYAVNIDWGDSTNKLVSLKSSDEPLIAAHTYSQAGAYQVTVTATDQSNQKAILEVAVVIDGKPKPIIPATISNVGKNFPTWPLVYSASLVVILLFGYILGKYGRRTSTPHTM